MEKGSSTKIVIVLVLITIIAGGFYYISSKPSVNPTSPTPSMNSAKMNMEATNSPELSDQQKMQLASQSSATKTQKSFDISGGNFYFTPNKITVNKGDKVTFVIKNDGGVHNLLIDELNVSTPIIKDGASETVTFTAFKTGSFVYYCSVDSHRQRGMWGTLTVN